MLIGHRNEYKAVVSSVSPSSERIDDGTHWWEASILTIVQTLLPRCEERKANLTELQAENKASKALGHAASIPEVMNIILYNNTKFEGGKENGKVPSRDLTWPASPLPVSSSVACQSWNHLKMMSHGIEITMFKDHATLFLMDFSCSSTLGVVELEFSYVGFSQTLHFVLILSRLLTKVLIQGICKSWTQGGDPVEIHIFHAHFTASLS